VSLITEKEVSGKALGHFVLSSEPNYWEGSQWESSRSFCVKYAWNVQEHWRIYV